MERGTTQKPRPRERTAWLQSSSRREFQKCGHKRCTRQVQNFLENRGATYSAWPPASLTTTPEEQQLGSVDFIDIIVSVNVFRCTLKASIPLLSTLLVLYACLLQNSFHSLLLLHHLEGWLNAPERLLAGNGFRRRGCYFFQWHSHWKANMVEYHLSMHIQETLINSVSHTQKSHESRNWLLWKKNGYSGRGKLCKRR